MNSKSAANLRKVIKQRRTPVATGVVGAALAVGLVLGLPRMQPAPHGGVSTEGSARQTVAPASAARSTGTGGRSATAVSVVARPRGTTMVYLVRTPEQEQALRAWLAQGDSGVPGGASANATIILAPSAAEADFARAAALNSRSASGAAPTVLDAWAIQRP